jgi:predicted dehydrogenase
VLLVPVQIGLDRREQMTQLLLEIRDGPHVTQNVSLFTAMASADPVRIGLIGCGTISVAYLTNLNASPDVHVLACADAIPERATARAAEFGVPRACTTGELLADPRIELVVNLTVPNAHAPVGLAALEAGKHLYNEKPLAATRDDGLRILEVAADRGLVVGGAPDTFLGAGIQTCLKLIEDGDVGEALAASAFMLNRGPENWHENPAFFYQPGAGPLFDVGPYYVTALVCALGPVRRVAAIARTLYAARTATKGPRAGETFPVTIPTFVSASLEFESGAVATLVTSFGISGHDLPNIQLYCTRGIVGVPDPNTFGGPVRFRPADEDSTWTEIPLAYRHTDSRAPRNFRGLGVVEMARAIRNGEEPRASGRLAFHVLDVMVSILESDATGRSISVSSRCERPPLMPLDAYLELAR